MENLSRRAVLASLAGLGASASLGADLSAADLRGARFLHCPQLEAARNWQAAYRDEDLACGAAIPRL